MMTKPKSNRRCAQQRAETRLSLLAGLCLILLLGLSFVARAQEFSVDGSISGNWKSPAQTGHGVQIEVVDGSRAVVAWYTYDGSGEAIWLFGVGDIQGDTIQVALEAYSGALFPPNFDPAMVETEAWGEVTLSFEDCDTGTMDWTTTAAGFTSGSMTLVRVTAIDGHSCGASETFETEVRMNLDAGPGQWQPLFSDYTAGAQVNAMAEWMTLPGPYAHLDGWVLAGTNVTDGLGLFLKTAVGGLQPDTDYLVEMDVRFATRAPQGCGEGLVLAAGESVYVKLGATGVEPLALQAGGAFELNIDKGVQASGGADAVVAGTIANDQQGCPAQAEWQLKTVSTRGKGFTARTDADGRLWLLCGTDSAVTGASEIYITAVAARMTPAD